MDKKKEHIGDVLVATAYANHRGWCWRPFMKFTGDSVKVNNKWEPIEPFKDTFFGRKQLEALVAHFGMHIEYNVYDDIHVLRAYNKKDEREKNIVMISCYEHPHGEDYRRLQIRFVKKNLKEIFKDDIDTIDEEK